MCLSVQQPHALAWDWKEETPHEAAAGNPKLWESTEEPTHSDFLAVPAGTGAVMHQYTPPGSPGTSAQLPSEAISNPGSPACIELTTMERQDSDSGRIPMPWSPRSAPAHANQLPADAVAVAGRLHEFSGMSMERRSPTSECPSMPSSANYPIDITDPLSVDAPAEHLASLTISPTKRCVPITACATAGAPPMEPIIEDPASITSPPPLADFTPVEFSPCTAFNPSERTASFNVRPGHAGNGNPTQLPGTRPISPGRYADAESLAGSGQLNQLNTNAVDVTTNLFGPTHNSKAYNQGTERLDGQASMSLPDASESSRSQDPSEPATKSSSDESHSKGASGMAPGVRFCQLCSFISSVLEYISVITYRGSCNGVCISETLKAGLPSGCKFNNRCMAMQSLNQAELRQQHENFGK